MKLKLQFGLSEPKREVSWWKPIKDFPYLVLYRSTKWEFVTYDKDSTGQVDYLCIFSEVLPNDPNWHGTFEDISHMFDSYGKRCECGAIYTSFPNFHMFFCSKYTKW